MFIGRILCRCLYLLTSFVGSKLLIVSGQETNYEPQKVELKLRDGRTNFEGRVDILVDGVHGTICDDYWKDASTDVVCRQLGFSGGEAYYYGGHFPRGTGKIWLDSLRCLGNETKIQDCPHEPWGDSDCTHDEDIGVRCKSSKTPNWNSVQIDVTYGSGQENQDTPQPTTEPIPLRDIKVRLRGKNTPHPKSEGYVEVYHNNKWTSICADSWDLDDSRVVCGQLGFSQALPIKYSEVRVSSKHRLYHVFLTNVSCVGIESTLQECKCYAISSAKMCKSKMAAVARCERGNFVEDARGKRKSGEAAYLSDEISKNTAVRVRSGASFGRGRIEVLYNGIWGTICGDRWDMRAANVACREMGFGTAKEIFLSAKEFGEGSGPVWLDQVTCHGDESSIMDCPVHNWTDGHASTSSFCIHAYDAGVACHIPEQRGKLKIRAVGGRLDMEGRIEVQHGRKWGSVCSEGWDIHAAGVACRQLGLGFAIQNLQEVTYFGGLNVPIIMSGVKCRGDELSLNQCKHDGWNNVKCRDYAIAGVVCTHKLPDLVADIRLIESSAYLEDRPLPMLQCAMEEHCVSSSAYDIIPGSRDYAYGRRRLLRFSSSIYNRGTTDFRPDVHKSFWEWHQCHQHHHSMEVFASYDIVDSDGNKTAEGHKASFCLEDSHCDPGVSQRYKCENYGDQGISVNCADEYKHSIDCQWIDITDMPHGNYLFRLHVNPQFRVAESDFKNNEVICNLSFNGYQAEMWQCRFAEDD
ncbi:lysyl oxidase homolog 2A-like [Ptychodera flava]|uniref:lysyl oxidase homolog 2A-like n=1 Tax=Ptychodera flava TaxID=63121 RepID=UPI00396A3BA4